MEQQEYAKLSEVEGTHWWFVSLRELLQELIEQHFREHRRASDSASGGGSSSDRQRVSPLRCLDAGCGTGANLELLHRLYPEAQLTAFDLSATAIDYARRKCPAATIFQCDLRSYLWSAQQDKQEQKYDLIISVDVLYAIGLEEARRGMEQLVSSLADDGLMVLHLPAYQWLRSYHDAAQHTVQRSTATQVRRYVESLGLRVKWLSYRIHLLFPLLLVARLGNRLQRTRDGTTSDLVRPSPLVNQTLNRVMRIENWLLVRSWRLPFGSSIILTANRR